MRQPNLAISSAGAPYQKITPTQDRSGRRDGSRLVWLLPGPRSASKIGSFFPFFLFFFFGGGGGVMGPGLPSCPFQARARHGRTKQIDWAKCSSRQGASARFGLSDSLVRCLLELPGDIVQTRSLGLLVCEEDLGRASQREELGLQKE